MEEKQRGTGHNVSTIPRTTRAKKNRVKCEDHNLEQQRASVWGQEYKCALAVFKSL